MKGTLWLTDLAVLSFSYFINLLYSIDPSLGTDTTGCGTCQNSIYSIAKHNHFTLHIDIDAYNVSVLGKYLYH
jgi:hypothetical protein